MTAIISRLNTVSPSTRITAVALLALSAVTLVATRSLLNSYAVAQAEERQEVNMRVAWSVLGRLGTTYRAAYDPIRDAGGRVVGIIFVGVPTAEFLAPVEAACASPVKPLPAAGIAALMRAGDDWNAF